MGISVPGILAAVKCLESDGILTLNIPVSAQSCVTGVLARLYRCGPTNEEDALVLRVSV